MNTQTPRKRALARYLGGKNRIAPWIISFFPDHKFYVEPFGGSAAVLLNKKPAFLDVYNDKYNRLVNFFRVLKNKKQCKQLIELIRLTPYAQAEYQQSFEEIQDPVQDALNFIVNSMMSYGGGKYKPGFKRNGLLRGTAYPKTWREYPAILKECANELLSRDVEINNIDALDIMTKYDSPETLHYIDPPYLQETRCTNCRYEHDYTTEDHVKLLDFIQTLKGMVVISGYDTPLYNNKLKHWHKETKETSTTAGKLAVEILWMNFQTSQLQLPFMAINH